MTGPTPRAAPPDHEPPLDRRHKLQDLTCDKLPVHVSNTRRPVTCAKELWVKTGSTEPGLTLVDAAGVQRTLGDVIAIATHISVYEM